MYFAGYLSGISTVLLSVLQLFSEYGSAWNIQIRFRTTKLIGVLGHIATDGQAIIMIDEIFALSMEC